MLYKSVLISGLLGLSAAALVPEAAPVVEGKHKPCKKAKCNTLTPKGDKFFKKAENKRKRTHLVLEQQWTSSTTGSTINENFDRRRRHKSIEKRARGSFSEDSFSASKSVSIEKYKEGKRHRKRGVSYSFSGSVSAEHRDGRFSSKKSLHKKNKKKCYLKVKPRKHRHHTRKIVIDECAESSTYAFDVKRAQKHSHSASGSLSRSYSKSEESFSASKSVNFSGKGARKAAKEMKSKGAKNKGAKNKGKRHAKRGLVEDNVEGKRRKSKFNKSASVSYSEKSVSFSASRSFSISESSEHCEFERVPVKVCCPPKKKTSCKKRRGCPRISSKHRSKANQFFTNSSNSNSSSR